MELLVKFKVAVCKFIRKSKGWILHKAIKFKILVSFYIIHVSLAMMEILS